MEDATFDACKTCGRSGAEIKARVRTRCVDCSAARAAVADAAAKYQSAIADAVEACAVSPEARCFICLEGGDLVRDCACRGPDAGYAHVECLVKMAESKPHSRRDMSRYFDSLHACTQCKAPHMSKVSIALRRAGWLRCAGWAEDCVWRVEARNSLCVKLGNHSKFEEAEDIALENLDLARRVFGADHEFTIDAESNVAWIWLGKARGRADAGTLRKYLEMTTRVFVWRERNYGRDDCMTMSVAGTLQCIHKALGMYAEAEAIARENDAISARVDGPGTNFHVDNAITLITILVQQRKMDEARALQETTLQQATRVLGPNHFFTTLLRQPSLLEEPRTRKKARKSYKE